jgi:hypothetical protein
MSGQETQPSSLPPLRTSGGLPPWTAVLIVPGAIVLGLFMLAALVFAQNAQALEAARRARCMNNIRQIGLAMLQYAGDHDDSFPPLVDAEGNLCPVVVEDGNKMNWDALRNNSRSSFALLLKLGYLTTTKVFLCPSSNDEPPPDAFPTDFKAADLRNLLLGENNCSCGWDPTKKHTVDVSCAILADKPRQVPGTEGTAENNSENHGGEGQSVFYNDGHVKWGTTPRADFGNDRDIYTGSAEPGEEYWKSTWDAKIIR